MNNITFIVNGDPFGKQRPRTFTNKRGVVRTITLDETRNYEDLIRWEYKRQCPNIYFIGELEVIINAYFGISKSWSKKKKKQAEDGEIRPNITPDCDNIAKAILDSLNKVCYDDDKDVQDLHIHKYYASEPRVEVTICGDWVKV